jgi:hypothetical protein
MLSREELALYVTGFQICLMAAFDFENYIITITSLTLCPCVHKESSSGFHF